MNNYDEKFLNRFMELLEHVKFTNETIIINGGFLQKVRFLASKQKYRDILDEKMKDLAISNLVIKLAAGDITNLDLEMNYDILRNSVIIKPALIQDNPLSNKNKEENNMFKILEIYKEKKTKEIEQKYDKQLEDLEFNDPVTVYLHQAENTIKEILKTEEDVRLIITSNLVECTQETLEKRKAVIDTIHKEKEELNNVIEEIEALLEFAPNYEESTKILLAYDIIDKKGKIK